VSWFQLREVLADKVLERGRDDQPVKRVKGFGLILGEAIGIALQWQVLCPLPGGRSGWITGSAATFEVDPDLVA
jgi:hypothetical protein